MNADTRVPVAVDRITAGIPIIKGKSSAGLSLINIEQVRGNKSRVVNATYNQQLWSGASLSLNAFIDVGTTRGRGLYAGLSFPIGPDIQSSTSASSSNNGLTLNAEASKSLGSQAGDYGWSLMESNAGKANNASGSFAYRSSIARTEIRGNNSSSGSSVSAEMEGAMVLSPSGVNFGGRIGDSSAIVDVGAPGVPVFHDHRLVGTTGWDGTLLVSDLSPYQKNILSIDIGRLPFGAQVEKTTQVIIPAAQSTTIVHFGVKTNVESAVVILVDAQGKPIRAGTKGQLDGADRKFSIGYDGKAYLSGLQSQNELTVDLLDHECRVSFAYQRSETKQTVIGPLTCN